MHLYGSALKDIFKVYMGCRMRVCGVCVQDKGMWYVCVQDKGYVVCVWGMWCVCVCVCVCVQDKGYVVCVCVQDKGMWCVCVYKIRVCGLGGMSYDLCSHKLIAC